MYSTVSIGLPHMESPTGFSQAPLKQGFLTSHYRTSSFCCLPIFFITTVQAPYKLHKISVGPNKVPHTLFFCFKQNSLFGGSPLSMP